MARARYNGTRHYDGAPGPGVDIVGNPVLDPTENVKALNEAANRRQDDLRAAFEKYTEARIADIEFVAELRAKHNKELREAESNRINATREVDINATKTESERSQRAIDSLATRAATDAATLRDAVTNTAATIAKQTAEAISATARQTAEIVLEINKRLSSLEQTSYKAAGEKTVVDPMQAQLIEEVRALRAATQLTQGKGEGSRSNRDLIFVIGFFVVAALQLVLHFWKP